jgi:hypothetical protein
VTGNGSAIGIDFANTVANNPLFLGTYGGWSGLGMDQTTAGLRLAGDITGTNPVIDFGYYSGGTVAHANWNSRLKILNNGVTTIYANSTTAPGLYVLQTGSSGYSAIQWTGNNGTDRGVLTTYSGNIYIGRWNGGNGAYGDILINTTNGNVTFGSSISASNLSGTNTGDQTLPTLSSLGAVAKAGDTMSGNLTLSGYQNPHITLTSSGGSYSYLELYDGTSYGYLIKNTSATTSNGVIAGALYLYTDTSKPVQIVHSGASNAAFLSGGDVYIRGQIYVGGNGASTGTQVVYNSGSWAITVNGFNTSRTNYKGVTDDSVAGQLMWKNYGNSHTIFDSSNGTTPSGTSCDRWTPTYPVENNASSNSWGYNPVLMGWNGSATYGVKVDWARYAVSSGTTSQTSFSSLTSTGNVAVNSGNNSSSSSGGLTLWDAGGTTTSWIGFKNNASTAWGYHGGSTATGAYSTYFIMDTASRGWIFRYATPGGTNFAGTNVASIQSDTGQMALGSVYDGTSSNPTFAQLNVCNGRGAATNYRDIDIKGSWAAGEGHSITATHGSTSGNIVGQITFQHDSPGSRIRFGKLYASGDQTTYPMELISNSSGGGGNLYVTGDITAYYSDERLKTKVAGIDNALDKVLSLSGFKYVNNDLAKEHGYDSDKVQIGMSAQEVQKIAPEIVKLAHFDTEIINGEVASKSGENYLTLDYSKLVPILVEAIKEQQTQIEDLKKALFNIIDSK